MNSINPWVDFLSQDRNRWKAGSECEKILEWLENRDRLGELPEALAEIGREDLVDLIS